MNSKIDKIIAQVGLKSPYDEPPRLRDATQPIILDPEKFGKMYGLKKEDLIGASTEWIIPFVFAKNTINVIYAPAGSGKTFSAWGIAKIAYLTNRVKTVFYFDADNGIQTLFNRHIGELIRYKNFHYISLNSPRAEKIYDEGIKTNEALLRALATSPADFSNALIVIDSLKDFSGALDIESGKDMNQFFRILMKLREKNSTLLILHHTNKQTKDENGEPSEKSLTFTGSQMILNSSDTAYLVYQKNRETNKKDNRIDYVFKPEKDRIGGAEMEVSVFTKATETKRIYDVVIRLPKLSEYLSEKDNLLIEAILSVLSKEEDRGVERGKLSRLLKKHPRDKRLTRILKDFDGFLWVTKKINSLYIINKI
jgi:hypothetical protein